jgi:hypothetical protein
MTSDVAGSHATSPGIPAELDTNGDGVPDISLNTDGVAALTLFRSDGTFRCSGSLVHDNFVATAAHCVTDDVAASSLAAAGIAAPTDREIDGVNLLPFLRGERTGDPHEYLCWQQRQWARPNQRDPGVNMRSLHQFAIRSGQWKAIRND